MHDFNFGVFYVLSAVNYKTQCKLEIVYTRFHQDETHSISFFFKIVSYHPSCLCGTLLNMHETLMKPPLRDGNGDPHKNGHGSFIDIKFTATSANLLT